jgi:hypothetical protein
MEVKHGLSCRLTVVDYQSITIGFNALLARYATRDNQQMA